MSDVCACGHLAVTHDDPEAMVESLGVCRMPGCDCDRFVDEDAEAELEAAA